MRPKGEPRTKKWVTSKSSLSSKDDCAEFMYIGIDGVAGGDKNASVIGDNSPPPPPPLEFDILLEELPVRLSENKLFGASTVSLMLIRGFALFVWLDMGVGETGNELDALCCCCSWFLIAIGFGDGVLWFDPRDDVSTFGRLFDWHKESYTSKEPNESPIITILNFKIF